MFLKSSSWSLLSTLAFFALAVWVGLGTAAAAGDKEEEAAEAVRKAFGYVSAGNKTFPKKYGELTVIKITNVDAVVEQLPHFKYLWRLSLTGLRVKDEHMKAFGALTDLTSLSLQELKITDDGLEYISKFKKLEELSLGRMNIGAATMNHIGELENLR